jgi:eukaryotic-like serine/threonine-protein kinase
MVKTNRTLAADMTQDGAIMGTPAYMPPEQARGETAAVDTRSDIYSLGAILYEVLTLTPPVGRGGDAMAILMRVVDGTVDPPQKRSPHRWIPPELSAIAMKALTMEPDDRYQTVEELQRDIQLYQEGRSVSAKQDNAWEMFKKLLKRNKGVSVATALALVTLSVMAAYFLKINYDKRVEAENNYTKYQTEQMEKEKRTREAVPALVAAARRGVEQRDFASALTQVKLALDYDKGQTEARLLKGQLLVSEKQFAPGAEELKAYLSAKPDDAVTRKLLELCEEQKPNDFVGAVRISRILTQQKVFTLAERVVKEFGADSVDAMRNLLDTYRQPINAELPGRGSLLRLNPKGQLEWTSATATVHTLAPFTGIPLTTLYIGSGARVQDLSPLQGMPLTALTLHGAPVQDLSPLRGMKLNKCSLEKCKQLQDLTPLEGMPLIDLDLSYCSEVNDLTPLTGMPLKTLNLYGCVALTDLSPLKGMELTTINLTRLPLSKMSGMDGLREMTGLEKIYYVTADKGDPEAFWKKYDAGEFKK